MTEINRDEGDIDDLRTKRHTSESVITDELSLTDPTLVYVYGTNGRMRDVYDPAEFVDIHAALNQVMADASDSEQVTIQLPYTGSAGVSASTTFTVPAGQRTPSIKGWGWYGTVINYTATDGSPAMEVPTPENEEAYRWSGFHLSGPGSGSGGGGNGIQIGDATTDSTNHGQRLQQIRVTDFPGRGVEIWGFFTGRLGELQIDSNGGGGLFVDRLNGGNIENCMLKTNGGDQIHLQDSVWGVVGPGNDIDAGGGGGTPVGSIGVRLVSVNKRTSCIVFGNYFEENETHVSIENGGLPPRAPVIMANRMQSGTTGIHLVDNATPNNYGTFFGQNWFESVSTQDILLDGTNAILGPNFHANTTAKVTDNSGGDFASVSQTTGSYPW
jgi:hypothetical protein